MAKKAFDYLSTVEWLGTSLMVQWLRLHIPNAGDMGSIPGPVSKIPHATQQSPKNKKQKGWIVASVYHNMPTEIGINNLQLYTTWMELTNNIEQRKKNKKILNKVKYKIVHSIYLKGKKQVQLIHAIRSRIVVTFGEGYEKVTQGASGMFTVFYFWSRY